MLRLSFTILFFASQTNVDGVYSPVKPYKYPYDLMLPKPTQAAQANGCLLDALEKTCGISGQDKIQWLHTDLLNPHAPENAFLCCCPNPYVPCDESQLDRECLGHIGQFARDVEKATKTKTGDMEELLQDTRTNLLKGHEADFAPAMPYAKCSKDGEGFRGREDMLCEMLVWQWTQLGDGNMDEFKQNNCHWDGTKRAPNPDARKSGTWQSVEKMPKEIQPFAVGKTALEQREDEEDMMEAEQEEDDKGMHEDDESDEHEGDSSATNEEEEL